MRALFLPGEQKGRRQCPWRENSGRWFRGSSLDGKAHTPSTMMSEDRKKNNDRDRHTDYPENH